MIFRMGSSYPEINRNEPRHPTYLLKSRTRPHLPGSFKKIEIFEKYMLGPFVAINIVQEEGIVGAIGSDSIPGTVEKISTVMEDMIGN